MIDKIVRHLPDELVKARKRTIQSYFCGTKKEVENETYQSLYVQTKKMLLVITAFFVLMAGMAYSALNRPKDILVERDQPGGDSRKETISIETDHGTTDFLLDVLPKKYTKKEEQQAFSQSFSYLEQHMKGKNVSVNDVNSDLYFPLEIPGSEIKAAWDTSDLTVVADDGSVDASNVKKPVIVQVYVTLSYFTREETKIYPVCVIPLDKTQKKSALSKVENKIRQIEKDNAYRSRFVIPDRINGHKLEKTNDSKENLPMLLFLGLLAIALVWFSEEGKYKQLVKNNVEQSKDEYANVVSRFVLLLGAGMTVEGVVNSIVEDYQDRKRSGKIEPKYVYEQFAKVSRQFSLGVSPVEAFREFGRKMNLTCYGKLCTFLIQSITKGSADLLEKLQKEEEFAFLWRTQQAKRKGEQASTKLLMPMLLMLVVILGLLMFPAFLSFS